MCIVQRYWENPFSVTLVWKIWVSYCTRVCVKRTGSYLYGSPARYVERTSRCILGPQQKEKERPRRPHEQRKKRMNSGWRGHKCAKNLNNTLHVLQHKATCSVVFILQWNLICLQYTCIMYLYCYEILFVWLM